MNRFLRNKLAVASFILISLVSFAALFAPYVTLHSFDTQNIDVRLLGPTREYWMGTDSLGRDLFSRIVFGARVSMTVGLLTAFLSLILGTTIGALSGYLGGWVDTVLMRVVDIVYIFPSILIAILLMLLFGEGVTGIVLSLSMVGWVSIARLVRAQVMQIREMLHVESARATGATHSRVVLRHILPLVSGPLIVALTYQIPSSIMSESFLSFIGLGVQPPLSSWGTLANEGWRGMQSYPHLILFPGLVLITTMVCFQFLGDGLRDWLDPKTIR